MTLPILSISFCQATRLLSRLRRKSGSLTQYAVDYRYPGEMASKRQMEAALRHADQIRLECRGKLGLSLS